MTDRLRSVPSSFQREESRSGGRRRLEARLRAAASDQTFGGSVRPTRKSIIDAHEKHHDGPFPNQTPFHVNGCARGRRTREAASGPDEALS